MSDKLRGTSKGDEFADQLMRAFLRKPVSPDFALRFTIAACFLLVLGIPTMIFITGIWPNLGMVSHSAKTTGVVNRLMPEMHGELLYDFTAGGQRFTGQDQPPSGRLSDYKPGDAIEVYYDTRDPHHSLLESPGDAIAGDVTFAVLATLVGGGFIFAMVALNWRRRFKDAKK